MWIRLCVLDDHGNETGRADLPLEAVVAALAGEGVDAFAQEELVTAVEAPVVVAVPAEPEVPAAEVEGTAPGATEAVDEKPAEA